jgi:S-(hydroxymethyl)glutathione dehydrogenase/alcohol dehydrogenase
LLHLLGHEGSCIVAVGDSVNKVEPRYEAFLGWIKGEGLDAPGAKYKFGDQ